MNSTGTAVRSCLSATGWAQDHDYFLLPELGVGHPQTCMMDGLQASTGCTFGKLMIERQNYAKLAVTLWTPENSSVRIAIKPEFTDMLGKCEFFEYRKKASSHHKSPNLYDSK
ncbi:MAG: FmdE family protein [Bacteroidota bacterium]